jgi:hypothetical protein
MTGAPPSGQMDLVRRGAARSVVGLETIAELSDLGQEGVESDLGGEEALLEFSLGHGSDVLSGAGSLGRRHDANAVSCGR